MRLNKIFLSLFLIIILLCTACNTNEPDDKSSTSSEIETEQKQQTTSEITKKVETEQTTTSEAIEGGNRESLSSETTQPPVVTTTPSSTPKALEETTSSREPENAASQETLPNSNQPQQLPTDDDDRSTIYKQYSGTNIIILELFAKSVENFESPQIVITDDATIQTIKEYLDGMVLSSYKGPPLMGGSSDDGIISIDIFFMKDGAEEGYSVMFHKSQGDKKRNAAKDLNEPKYDVWYEINPAAFDYLKTFFDYQKIE